MAVTEIPAPRSANLRDQLSVAAVDACQSVLYCLREDTRDVVAAGLIGPHGSEIASIRRDDAPTFSMGKVASLTGTMAAVGLALCQEAGHGICRSVILDADEGRTLILAVPAGRRFFWLFVTAGESALLGQVVLHARECQDSLAEILEAEETTNELAARASA